MIHCRDDLRERLKTAQFLTGDCTEEKKCESSGFRHITSGESMKRLEKGGKN